VISRRTSAVTHLSDIQVNLAQQGRTAEDPKAGAALPELSLVSSLCPTTIEGQAGLVATRDFRGVSTELT
jgi:hypothetical protein